MTNHEIDILMSDIARGNMTALESLYREMSKPVYFYALHLSGNPDTAEDIMQDTFVSVMRNVSSYKKQEKGKNWIFTIAKNRYLDLQRHGKYDISLAEEQYVPAPDTYFTKSDNRLTALKMLESLNKKERDIVMLRLFGDMTLTQVSKELNLPKGTVFWTYNNAIKKLKSIYSGGDENE